MRELHGLSQRRLARDAGVSESTVNLLESGLARDVTLSTLAKLARRLGVTAGFLLACDRDEENVQRLTEVNAHLARYAPSAFPFAQSSEALARPCGVCGYQMIPGELHTQGDCILLMSESGRTVAYLAVRYGFTPAAIEAILSEEYRVRRQRRRPAAP